MSTASTARAVLPCEQLASRRIDVLVDQEERLRDAAHALGPDALESPLLSPVFAHCLVQLCLIQRLRRHVEAEFEL